MHYVYLIEGRDGQRHVGLTMDLPARLAAHNAGQSKHTSKHRPRRLVTYVAFSDVSQAMAFERHLKSGSGHAFARRRLWAARSHET